MKCPKCRTDAYIRSAEALGTTRVLHWGCRNKRCENYMKEICTERREPPREDDHDGEEERA